MSHTYGYINRFDMVQYKIGNSLTEHRKLFNGWHTQSQTSKDNDCVAAFSTILKFYT